MKALTAFAITIFFEEWIDLADSENYPDPEIVVSGNTPMMETA